MQWLSIMVILVRVAAHSISDMLAALVMRPDSPTAPKALLGTAVMANQLEYAVKVCTEMQKSCCNLQVGTKYYHATAQDVLSQ